MQELASTIRENLEALTEAYEQRLQAIAGYPEFKDQVRRDIARDDLDLIAGCLEAGDEADFIDFTREQACERLEQGFTAESLMEALTAIEDTLSPLVTSVEAARFLWHMMSRARDTVSLQADRMLRQAEQRFRSLTDSLAEGIFIHQEGILRYVGREAARILGYDDPDDLVGRSILDFIHPDEREYVAGMARRRVAGEAVPEQYETRLLKKDGSPVDVWLYSTLVEYEGRVATQGAFIDITRRKRAEEMLERQAAQLTTLNRIGRDVASILDQEDLLQRAVDAVQEDLGYLQAAVLLVDEETDELYVVAATENFWEIIPDGYRQPVGEGLIGTAAETGEILLVNDVPGDSRAYRVGEWLSPSSLSAPIRIGGEVIGVLQVEAAVPDAFDENDEIVMGTLADQIGVALDNARLYEQAYQEIAERKRLEQQIQASLERRARQVETSTEIAQEIAAAAELDEIYRRVVALVKERFGYYYAQIFRYDRQRDTLVMAEGHGEVGERLKAAGHSLPYGEGVVGTAAAAGEPTLVPDVAENPAWVPHLDLPDTEGELAVPIKLRDEVLGVLDVQSDEAGALTEEDQIMLLGLAGQIASAIESTRLREEMEQNLRELERLTRAMSREGWETFRREAGPTGYLFDQTSVVPAEDFWVSEIGLAAERETLVAPEGDDGAAAVAPLSVRGEVIGALGVQDEAGRSLARDEVALVASFAEQVALALENARLFEQTQEALAEAELLYNVTQTLITAGEPEEMLQAVAEPALETGADVATLFYVDTGVEGRAEWAEVAARIQAVDVEAAPVGTRYRILEFPMGRLVAANPHEPQLIADVERHGAVDERSVQILKATQAGGVAAIPLTLGERWLGIVTLSWPEPHKFTPQEQRLYSAIGPQVATMLENRRLFEQMQEALEEVEATHQLYLREQWEEFLPGLAMPTYERARPGVVPLSDAVPPEVGQAMMQREVVVRSGSDGGGDQAAVVAPITLRGEVIGALGLQAEGQEQRWTDEEIALIQSVTEQLALALENARLLEETQRRAQQEQALGQITTRLTRSLDMDTVLQTAVQELGQLLQMDEISVYVGNPEESD